MDKYDWLPSESAHEQYPMEIVRGNFIFKDGSTIYIPDGKVVNDGWGQFVSTNIVGAVLKPIPIELQITWFSYAEDKFYAGSFVMPFEKISNLFKVGLESRFNGKKMTYDQIIVGLAPKGNISVWLDAEGEILEVATFKALEADVDWNKINDNSSIARKEYINVVLSRCLKKGQVEYLNVNGVPDKLFEKYKKQYPWRVEIVRVTPIEMWLNTYNGEQEFFGFAPGQNERTDRGVPKNIILNWHDSSEQKFKAKISFDESEIFKAYEKFFSYSTENKVKLQIEISETTHTVRLSLSDSKYILYLEKCAVKMFSIS